MQNLDLLHQVPPDYRPQLQELKWIKSKYGKALTIIRLGQKNFMDLEIQKSELTRQLEVPPRKNANFIKVP